MSQKLIEELTGLFEKLDPEILKTLSGEVLATTGRWVATPGPQLDAYNSEADILLYGGQAGGGKSALLVGLALNKHKRSLLMRRQYTDLGAIIEDVIEKHGTREGFNGAPPARLRTKDGRLVEFGAAKLPGDEEHWKGQPHDLLGIDEASQFLEGQVRFLMGWVRSTEPGQRCRVVLATNPPEQPGVGEWLREWFAPWLDPNFPNPAKPGELRWYITDPDGNDQPVEGPEPIIVKGRTVRPMSRTFIPAALRDNPFLASTNYAATLDALPEPLRSAVRDGNWMISHDDDEWQIIPTNWVMQAQQRWTENPPRDAPMCSMGVDVAQGGSNSTVIACRYDGYFAKLVVVPGKETPYGTDVAALVMKHRRNNAEVIVDAGGGYGGAAIEHLKANSILVKGFLGAERSGASTADRQLRFINKRAEAYWRFREALDPDQHGGSPIALPHDNALFADLVSARYEVTPRGVKVEDKQEIIKRLGRSPDRGDAVVMAWSGGPTYRTHGQIWKSAINHFIRPRVFRSHPEKRRRHHG